MVEADPSGEWMTERNTDGVHHGNGFPEDDSRESLMYQREIEICRCEKEIAERELELAHREIVLLRENRSASPGDRVRQEEVIVRGGTPAPAIRSDGDCGSVGGLR